MQSSKRPIEIDPDYELSDSTIKRIRIKEDQERKDTLQKITQIINSHFSAELSTRQAQIETVQGRVVQVKKTVHLLRHALVKSYYNNANCALQAPEEPSRSGETVIDSQTRIHPALKKLIGKNAELPFGNLGTRRSKHGQERRAKSETATAEAVKEEAVPQSVVKCERVEEAESKAVVNGESSCDSVRNRKKGKYRVVVGNISKYMPAKNREDSSTHKWMIYVRGPKEAPNVSHFIKKVVFYLHPSYRPCDVIELDKDPFHLSRRGWGEFPVRVQIFFHCTLNKPVDIIHNLKLDKTHTGLQTLGNETIVNLYLYDDAIKDCVSTEINASIKQEEVKEEPPASQEHDYYTSDSELPVEIDEKSETEVLDCVQLDHTYCLPSSSSDDIDLMHGVSNEEDKTTEEIVCDLKSDLPINGNTMYKNSAANQLIPQFLSKETQSKTAINDAKTVILHKDNSGTMQNGIDFFRYKIDIPVENFKGVLEVLPFLFRRLPLVTNLAADLSYKCRYPYAAKSLNEYLSWNVGKRRSSEWRRAKTVLEYVQSTKIFGYEMWDTKRLILYARSHAYTPNCTYSLFANSDLYKSLLTAYIAEEEVPKTRLFPEPNVPINITDDVDSEDVSSFKHDKSKYLSKSSSLECSFIRKVALDCRVKLQPEEIAPGVLCNAAEVVILESLKCLVNDLVRNARTHRVLKGNFCEKTTVIGPEEVLAAVNDRLEFRKILHSYNNKSQIEYYL